jgi:hypothetical protein
MLDEPTESAASVYGPSLSVRGVVPPEVAPKVWAHVEAIVALWVKAANEKDVWAKSYPFDESRS